MSRLEFAACLALFVTGVYATSFGPALPILAHDFGVSLDAAGLLISVLFLASITASAVVAIRLHSGEQRLLAATGLAAITAACTLLALTARWPLALVAVGLMGAGDGLMVAATHTIAARSVDGVSRGINRLNIYFAVGAVAGPLWAGGVLALDSGAREVVYLGIAALSFVVLGILWSGDELPTPRSDSESVEPSLRAMDRLAWVIGLLLFLYVGAEFGLGSWVASYSSREFGAGIFTGALVTSGYWGALMLGRLLSGRLFALEVPPRRVLLWSIVAGLLSSSLIASANGIFAIAVGAAFASGLAFGPIWPAAMSIAARDRGGNGPAAMVTIGNAGGFAFPWFQGRLLVSAGASTGIAMTAVLCALMLVVLVASRGLHPAPEVSENRLPIR